MKSVFLKLGVIFTSFSFVATAYEHDNYYVTEDNKIGDGEYFEAYPGK